ncbi:hypothetical protein [Pseudotabrizicola sp. L79]|uniref:hypothetical protein n=1 Tax=Pseudotabrizicola sp. L79 TaxID=3118402 RepID=UPI002F95086E
MAAPPTKAAALAELGDALGADLALIRCLSLKPESAVFLGQMAGQPVILKQFFQDAEATLARMQDELELVSTQMQGTRHAINRVLRVLPDLGVAVLEHAGDMRLSAALAEAGAQRPALIAQAGEWLASYIGPRHRIEKFRPRRWIADLPQPSLGGALGHRVAMAFSHRARALQGASFTRAATHGDFVPVNAMWRDGQIIGIDVQGQAWLPLARDLARFLVWLHLTSPTPGPLYHGIAKADLTAMLTAPLLPQDEVQTILPFFIGQQLLALAEKLTDPQPQARAMRALEHWAREA